MKALKYILYSLVTAFAAGLLAYQGLIAKNLESSDVVKSILLIAAVFGIREAPRSHRYKRRIIL